MPTKNNKHTKQPGEKRPYYLSFQQFFDEHPDESPADPVVIVTNPGITVVSTARQGAIVKVVLDGGTDGEKYKVTVQLPTTPSGYKVEAELFITVKDS